MTPIDIECMRLAKHFLGDYRLSGTEFAQEQERLAQAFQYVAEAELENLAHRLKA
jgi:hypothetical protein